jgi:hypothetical protein
MTNDSTYPTVSNNALVNGSLAITSKIFLDQMTTSGTVLTSLEVTNSAQDRVPPSMDQMVTGAGRKFSAFKNYRGYPVSLLKDQSGCA